MQPILQGSLEQFQPAQLLMLFSSYRHTGTLEAVSSQGKARVLFRDGDIVYADASPGTTAEETVVGLFLWNGGTFTFFDEAVLPEGVQPRKLDLQALVSEGTRRAEEQRHLLELYPSEEIVLSVIEDPRTEGRIDLTPVEFKTLMKIGAGRRLAQLRADLKRSAADLYPVLHRLETNGLVQRQSPTPATQRLQAVAAEPPSAQVHVPDSSPAAETSLVGSLTLATGEMFPLVDEAYAIGRHPENEIRIDDSTVSTVHALITRTKDGFAVQDAQSRNGTFVNGERVTAPRLLVDADVIRLGKVLLTFNLARPQEQFSDTRISG
jgi:hypothetical protein